MKQQNSPGKKSVRDLSGQRFGHLTAIAPTGEGNTNPVIPGLLEESCCLTTEMQL